MTYAFLHVEGVLNAAGGLEGVLWAPQRVQDRLFLHFCYFLKFRGFWDWELNGFVYSRLFRSKIVFKYISISAISIYSPVSNCSGSVTDFQFFTKYFSLLLPLSPSWREESASPLPNFLSTPPSTELYHYNSLYLTFQVL